MRLPHACLIGLAVALPLTIASVPTRAEDSGGLLGQAQRLLNNGGQDQQSAYERGREDERRRQAAARERRRERDQHTDRYDDQRAGRYDADRDRAAPTYNRTAPPYRPAVRGDRDDPYARP